MTTTNTLKTVALLGLLSAILIVGGQALAGRGGMYIGLVFAVAMNFGSYFFSEKIALSTYNAQPVTPTENPDVYARVQPLVRHHAFQFTVVHQFQNTFGEGHRGMGRV